MRYILITFFLTLVSLLSAQTGRLYPSYIGHPTDSSEMLSLKWNPETGRAEWMQGDTVIGGGNVFAIPPDTLCALIEGDTVCVSQDSIHISGDSICVIQGGDTLCVIQGSASDTHIGNSNITLEGLRTVTLNNNFLRFIQSGTLDGLQITPLSVQKMVGIQARYAGETLGVNAAMLELNNTLFSGTERNAFIRYQNGTNIFSMGEDLSINGFTFSDSVNLKNPVWYYKGGGGTSSSDTLFFAKRTMVRSGLLDKDGDPGTSGQILSSTGTGVDWIGAGGAIPINDLQAADGTNTIDNTNYEQEWQWSTLSAEGLTLSSTSTAAAGDAQRLLNVALSGANANNGQDTYAGYFSNTHTGTGAINYGIHGIASGGTLNTGVLGTGSTIGVQGIASGSGRGVSGTSTSGNGIHGISSSGIGLYGETSSGTGLWAQSSTGLGARIISNTANTSTVSQHTILSRTSSGTPAAGLGSLLEFQLGSTTTGRFSNGLTTKWTDATDATRTSQFIISGVNSATTNDIIYFEGDKRVRFNGRSQEAQGADVASVAGAITLGSDGNFFEITGTESITLINSANWQNGSVITLGFTGAATLVDGTSSSGDNITLVLAGNTNFTASADDLITLRLCEIGGVQAWREQSRSVN